MTLSIEEREDVFITGARTHGDIEALRKSITNMSDETEDRFLSNPNYDFATGVTATVQWLLYSRYDHPIPIIVEPEDTPLAVLWRTSHDVDRLVERFNNFVPQGGRVRNTVQKGFFIGVLETLTYFLSPSASPPRA